MRCRNARTNAEEVERFDEVPNLSGEDEALILIQSFGLQLLLRVPRPMELASFHGLRREAHRAAALLRLRLTERETPAVLGVRERLRHPDGRAVEINIFPLQPEQLSASHAGCGTRARRGLQGGL